MDAKPVQWLLMMLTIVGASRSAAPAADPPAVETTMAFHPVQKDIEYDVPDPKTYKTCKVTVVRGEGKVSGWVVFGPAGQTLRRFMDTNGDGVVDQWSYYQSGFEVYRDIDANFNNKVDQSRWLNTGGMRWGIDVNEDGRIDQWKMISAEELSRVAVRALVSQDAATLASVLITKDELKSLGVTGAASAKILDSVSDPAVKLRKAVHGSKLIAAKTKWTRFDASSPSLIPADQVKSAADIVAYENAMVIVENGGTPGLVALGEVVRVGDVWKLTGIPQPLEGNAEIAGGLLMQQELAAATPAAGAATPDNVSPAVQKLIEELGELDKAAPPPTAGRAALTKYGAARADVLTKLRAAAQSDDEQAQWTKYLADSLAAGVQGGTYPEGISRLKELDADLRKTAPASPYLPYVEYRLEAGEYSLALRDADNEGRQKLQDRWVKYLEKFVLDHPKADDAPDAGLQLAIAHEFNGKIDAAREWYEKLVKEYAATQAGERAAGALRRINLVGKPLVLAGAGLQGGPISVDRFRGKTLVVLFWDTRCVPCTEDLPQLKSLYAAHRAQGLEIVGVNLDLTADAVPSYLTQHKVAWPQIFEPGGLESKPARAFGIVSLPTMFIVDPQGKVTNRGASVEDVKALFAEEPKKLAEEPKKN